MVADGTAPKLVQSEDGATYDAIIKKDTVQVDIKKNSMTLLTFQV
jgi:hypothetical protein